MKLKPSLDAEKCGVDHECERPAREKPARLGAFGGPFPASFAVRAAATGCLGKRARKGKPAPGRSQANGLRGS